MTSPTSVPANYSRPKLLEKLLCLILAVFAGQTLIVIVFGLIGEIRNSWMASAALLAAVIAASVRFWKEAGYEERAAFAEPWKWILPWGLLALLAFQIYAYPSAMNDSLSYRIPRIYLWLQEGSITTVETADWRINAMTIGWESLALPFYSLNIPKGARLINLSLWLTAYQIIHSMARSYGAGMRRSNWIALAFVMVPGFILQAPSTANDFCICVLLLIGIHFMLIQHHQPGPLPVLMSLLALVLAANVKPQFLVLGIGWLTWWGLGPGRPWKQLHWSMLLALTPIYILISPLLKLFGNWVSVGSITGEKHGGTENIPALLSVLANCIQFGFSQLQLPAMPNVASLNNWLDSYSGFERLHQILPKFGCGLTELPLVDNASYGLFHSLMISAGLVLGWKRCSSETRWMALLAVPFFMAAASQVSVSTLGRSFMGFAVPLFPLAVCGLARSRVQILIASVFSAGFACLILNPSHPLWPCDQLERLARSQGSGVLAEKLHIYNTYRQRALTGKGMLDEIPKGETVGVLVRAITPIVNLWRPDWRAHRIKFIHNQDADQFDQSGIGWLVIGDKAKEQFPEAHQEYTRLAESWERVKAIEYRPNLQQGPETWTLYHRKSR